MSDLPRVPCCTLCISSFSLSLHSSLPICQRVTLMHMGVFYYILVILKSLLKYDIVIVSSHGCPESASGSIFPSCSTSTGSRIPSYI